MAEPKLFGDRPNPDEQLKGKKKDQDPAVAELSNSITALGSRLRVIEEQYSIFRGKAQLTEQNLLDYEKESREDIRKIEDDLVDIKQMLKEMNEKLQVMDSELQSSVKEHEIQVLEKYVDFWNPGRFITRKQLKEKLDQLEKET